LIFALFTIGTTFQVASAVNNEAPTTADRSTVIEEGKQIFLKGCSSCHGLNAEGSQIAPSLIGVGAASVDFQVATGRMPMADMSSQAMRKPPVYDAEEVNALATYVASPCTRAADSWRRTFELRTRWLCCRRWRTLPH
jgi:ubiquinol-cytochrome c reductase cytochrome c subunit